MAQKATATLDLSKGGKAMSQEQAQPAATDPRPSELTIDDAVALGLRLIGQRELEDASTLFRRILEAAPEHPDALNLLGVATYHLGDARQALELIGRAAAAAPEHAGIHNNLGNMLVENGKLAEAVEAYKRSIMLDPQQPQPLTNLASILKARQDFALAEELLRHALEIDARYGAAHHNLGDVLLRAGRPKEALHHFWEAARFMPMAYHNPYVIARAHERAGEKDTALQVLRDWLDKDPGNPEALHLIASFSGEGIPARASDRFVAQQFDRFAASFEAHLAELEYQAPKLVAEAFEAALGAPRQALRILDAGCGTGLCAPLLRKHAASLEGVDLSAGMLQKAQAAGLYDALEKAELTEFIANRPGAYDAIISADTLCYFGKLEDFAAAAFGSLRAGGTLVFTVEALGEDPELTFRLDSTGRYAHSGPYVDRVLTGAGFDVVAREARALRMEALEPVMGFVVTAVAVARRRVSGTANRTQENCVCRRAQLEAPA